MSEIRRMVLDLDPDDYDTIQKEITSWQVRSRANGAEGTIVPEGDSNLAGAILAECIRDLDDYRALSNSDRPTLEDE